jgi:hypothetical protein
MGYELNPQNVLHLCHTVMTALFCISLLSELLLPVASTLSMYTYRVLSILLVLLGID